MPYTIVTGDSTSSVWYYIAAGQFKLASEIKARYSPGTDWEKVFAIGDVINSKLNLTERDTLNEVQIFRSKRKKRK